MHSLQPIFVLQLLRSSSLYRCELPVIYEVAGMSVCCHDTQQLLWLLMNHTFSPATINYKGGMATNATVQE